MHSNTVHKIALALKALVVLALLCNIITLFLVPMLARQRYIDPLIYNEMLWDSSLVWQEPRAVVLMLFLWVFGLCTATILWQCSRVLNTILQGAPFSCQNAVSLRWAAICSFFIAAAAAVRTLWSISFYHSPRPLATYTTLLIPIFVMMGLLCLVMSALFRQAAQIRAENDLTI